MKKERDLVVDLSILRDENAWAGPYIYIYIYVMLKKLLQNQISRDFGVRLFVIFRDEKDIERMKSCRKVTA